MNPYQGQYWRDVDPNSTMTKMEHTYWITKQSVFKKIGKKEDECVVSSDAELDAKLELFRSIQESCMDLQKVIDRYQERICYLAQEENSMGRFLKEAGKADKTGAGKMMCNVGKSLSYSGQQRLALRTPLVRLYQEVETFRQRAISDTMANLKAMEKQRVEYRAALSWMKDVSQELDPEKHLDKFRKVQSQVRRSKQKFDRLKLDCLQKVDLLAAARCNMFSHALVLYHNSMVQHSEKTANTFQLVANSFKGYQAYDFCVLKELAEPSLKLAEQLGTTEETKDGEKDDTDILLFFESEYRDDSSQPAPSQDNHSPDNVEPSEDEPLLELGASVSLESGTRPLEQVGSIQLLGEVFKDDVEDWTKDWEEVFGSKDSPEKAPAEPPLPSQGALNDLGYLAELSALETQSSSNCLPSALLNQLHLDRQGLLDLQPAKTENPQKTTKVPQKKDAKDMTTWFNLFADLDPLADPDAIGAKSQPDRNC